MSASALLLNFANLVLCFACGWSAVCRLAKMHRRIALRIAFLYLGLFVGSVFSGLQFFFFGSMAGWPDVFVSVCVCLLLWRTVPNWRGSCARA